MLAKRGIYWTTAKGEQVHPTEMNTGHLFNTFKMIFNHMVEAFWPLNPKLHRVCQTRRYESILIWCKSDPSRAAVFMREFAIELGKRELTDIQRALLMEIMMQLVPRFQKEMKSLPPGFFQLKGGETYAQSQTQERRN